jgi:hypothetical protein
MFKLIVSAIIIGAIVVLIREYLKKAALAKLIDTVSDELAQVKTQLDVIDITEEVVAAKVKLKQRTEAVATQAMQLDGDAPSVPPNGGADK